MNEFSKKLMILNIRTGNFYSVLISLHNVSRSCYQLLNYTPGNLQSTLTEVDHHHLPVASHSISFLCQSKRLTSLGITRCQTVVLLLSMLCIIMATMNMSSLGSSLSLLKSFSCLWPPVHIKTTDGQSKVSFKLVVY